ncbi:MAG: oxidoreductase [Puia sp.]|nr:oxidoreductase [Puia sp.]
MRKRLLPLWLFYGLSLYGLSHDRVSLCCISLCRMTLCRMLLHGSPIYSLFLSCLCLGNLPLHAQRIEVLTHGPRTTSLRGLSVVNEGIIWVSGSNGTVGKSIDGGQNWDWMTVTGFEKRDFRDIEAFDENTAVIMAVAEPADILLTTDGGRIWKTVYENDTPGMFLDAMEFWNVNSGIVIGDPVKGRFFVTRSFDGGKTWKDIPFPRLPLADSGEACFAASGTNVRSLDRGEACFVSGGMKSRLFIRDRVIDLPIVQGRETTGANSVAIKDHDKLKGGLHLVVVGGDFAKDSSTYRNCAFTQDGGKTWIFPRTPPHGYRSCVEYLDKADVLACGLTGVDLSRDDCVDWQLISTESFNVCRRAKKGQTVFLAGNNGKIGKLVL